MKRSANFYIVLILMLGFIGCASPKYYYKFKVSTQKITLADLDPTSKDSIRTDSYLTLVDSSQLLPHLDITLEEIAEKNELTIKYYNDSTVLENYIPKSSSKSDLAINRSKNQILRQQLGRKYYDRSKVIEPEYDVGDDQTNEELKVAATILLSVFAVVAIIMAYYRGLFF